MPLVIDGVDIIRFDDDNVIIAGEASAEQIQHCADMLQSWLTDVQSAIKQIKITNLGRSARCH